MINLFIASIRDIHYRMYKKNVFENDHSKQVEKLVIYQDVTRTTMRLIYFASQLMNLYRKAGTRGSTYTIPDCDRSEIKFYLFKMDSTVEIIIL